MRRRLRTLAAVPTALLLAAGVTACDDDGTTETMVDEEPDDVREAPADLEGDVDAGGEDGTEETGGESEADADADLEVDEPDS